MPSSTPQHFLLATPSALLELTIDPVTSTVLSRQSTPLAHRLGALCASPDGRHVYATLELAPDTAGNTAHVLGWSRPSPGAPLQPLSSAPVPTQGVTPCFIARHPRLPLLAVTHFRGPGDRDASAGSVSLFDLDATGAVTSLRARLQFPGSGPRLPRQAASHPHCAVFTTSPDVLRVADLGTDSVWSIPLDNDTPELCGAPVRYPAEPGSGPRHIAIVQNGHALLVVTEMDNSLLWLEPADATTLSAVTSLSLLPAPSARAAAADIQISPDSRFAYASLRQLDDLAAFSVDLSAQTLTALPRTSAIGVGPRWLAMSTDGSLLAAANTGGPDPSVDFLRRDSATGQLEPTPLRFTGAYLTAAVTA
jgi:6-phosphogluconolactonase